MQKGWIVKEQSYSAVVVSAWWVVSIIGNFLLEPLRVSLYLCLSKILGTARHQREGEHHRRGDCRYRAHGVPRRPTRDELRPLRRTLGTFRVDTRQHVVHRHVAHD